MKAFLRPGFAALSLAALSGCASAPTPPAFCPQVAVLQQAANLTAFLPGRSDVGAELTTAQITGVAGSCTAGSKHLLHVTFKAGFSASNGPANHGAALTLPYFVALTNGDAIISKTNYTVTLTFDGNASAAQAVSQPVTVELANAPASANVQILVGFALTPDQLSYAAAHPNPGP
jgi:hypothetical protein